MVLVLTFPPPPLPFPLLLPPHPLLPQPLVPLIRQTPSPVPLENLTRLQLLLPCLPLLLRRRLPLRQLLPPRLRFSIFTSLGHSGFVFPSALVVRVALGSRHSHYIHAHVSNSSHLYRATHSTHALPPNPLSQHKNHLLWMIFLAISLPTKSPSSTYLSNSPHNCSADTLAIAGVRNRQYGRMTDL